MNHLRRWLAPMTAAMALLVFSSAPARAGVLINFTGGSTLQAGDAPGQSFTVPGVGSFNNIAFNWYGGDGPTGTGTPLAVGTLYLFTSAYTGTPAGLSSSSYFAASTSISGGQYLFNPGVTLTGGVQYFAYSDTLISYRRTMASDGDLYTGGVRYRAPGSTSANFAAVAADAQFRLDGTPVPEPSTLASLGLAGLVGLFAQRRRRLLVLG